MFAFSIYSDTNDTTNYTSTIGGDLEHRLILKCIYELYFYNQWWPWARIYSNIYTNYTSTVSGHRLILKCCIYEFYYNQWWPWARINNQTYDTTNYMFAVSVYPETNDTTNYFYNKWWPRARINTQMYIRIILLQPEWWPWAQINTQIYLYINYILVNICLPPVILAVYDFPPPYIDFVLSKFMKVQNQKPLILEGKHILTHYTSTISGDPDHRLIIILDGVCDL